MYLKISSYKTSIVILIAIIFYVLIGVIIMETNQNYQHKIVYREYLLLEKKWREEDRKEKELYEEISKNPVRLEILRSLNKLKPLPDTRDEVRELNMVLQEFIEWNNLKKSKGARPN